MHFIFISWHMDGLWECVVFSIETTNRLFDVSTKLNVELDNIFRLSEASLQSKKNQNPGDRQCCLF